MSSHSLKDNAALTIAYGFGSGLLPKAPGTWGSLAALLPGYYILMAMGPFALLMASAGLFFIGIWAANVHARIHDSHDAGQVVVDEFVGQWLAMIPLAYMTLNRGHAMDILMAFAAFRFFDIIKPWPIKLLDQQMKGGLGVMVDDVVAGLFAIVAFLGMVWVVN